MWLEVAARRGDTAIWEGKDEQGPKMWMGTAAGWRRVSHKYATSSRVTGLDPFGPVVRPEHRLWTSVAHFVSSWTGMTQHHKFEMHFTQT
jgi:hypothetical protein